MLYVFHVDTGRMIKFDMNVALSSVQNLKETIERLHGIPAPNIVLLVSGGEMLTPGSLVCSYSAGTDTNPIYMFSTVDIKPQPWPSIEPDIDFTEQVDRCLDLPATYSTVVTRAALAQQIYDLAREEEGICERLVHEQHLQQQGWSAVIANMEDLTEEFRRRFESFSKSFSEHLKKRSEYLELLAQFNKDLDNLSQIPILPGLMQNAEEEFHGFDEYLDNDEVFSKSQNQQSSVIEFQQEQEQQKSEGEHQESLQQQKESEEDSQLVKEEREGSNSKESSTERSGKGTETTIATTQQQQLQIQTQKGRTLTLLQWISAKENHNTPRVMSEECYQGLKIFDEDKFDKVKQDVQNIIRVAEQEEIKEIKGLEDRLCGLEKLMFQLKKHVQEQKELSTAFQQNQSRANNLGDASILPDLCASHRSQLLVMLSNHKTIRDFRRRISRAKDELGANLEKRLKFIVTIENKMSELDNNLLFYHRCLRRIERHLNIIQQIHQTPDIYVSAVTEVIRRRIFSGEFIQWASTLACDFYVIHNDEVSRRQQFNMNFDGHFLNTLFPGMHDMPPAFANDTPIIFDEHLPNLTKTDIDFLSTYLPELTSKVEFPDMGSVIEFFNLRSGTIKSAEENKNSSTTSGKLQSISAGAVGGTGAILHRPIDIHSHLKDGFESETDTEEFEKVGQSANEKHRRPSTTQMTTISTSTSENIRVTNSMSTSMDPLPEKRTVETLTEENLGETRSEVERLKTLLRSMSLVSYQSLEILRKQMQSLKNEAGNGIEDFQKKLVCLSESLLKIKEFSETQENETTRQLIGKYEKQINEIEENLSSQQNQFKELLDEKNVAVQISTEVICNMEMERRRLNEELSTMKDTIESLQEQAQNAEIEREKAVHECRERLIHDHKNELESLRCRFRLMTSMERSPSDTSLEKIEKPDMIEITYHESILNQTKEELNKEKELAIKAAIEEEKLKWRMENSPKTSLSTTTNEVENLKKIIDEKTRQFDQLTESEMLLIKENYQLKMKLGQLANEEGSDKSWLKDRVDTLNKEKYRLEEELNKEKSRRLEMETSFATLKGSMIGSHFEPNVGGVSRSRMSASQSVVKQGVTTESCSKGDIVFVVWNIRHGQFTIIQDSSNLYFVHGDSLPVLNLRLPLGGDGDIPLPFFAIGRVIDKEYCQARKDENRYKVAKGTKFYRVKLQPLAKSETSRWHQRRERLESTPSSTSVSRSTSKQHLIDSFAQTVEHSMISKDIVDSSVNSKERTVSISSTAEEEEEPLSLLSDRCYKYASLSEEDEKALVANTESTTSSNTDCAIATTANLSTSATSISGISTGSGIVVTSCPMTKSINLMTDIATNSTNVCVEINSDTNDEQKPEQEKLISTETSSEKDPDDSDEYRSLEAKDESFFA